MRTRSFTFAEVLAAVVVVALVVPEVSTAAKVVAFKLVVAWEVVAWEVACFRLPMRRQLHLHVFRQIQPKLWIHIRHKEMPSAHPIARLVDHLFHWMNSLCLSPCWNLRISDVKSPDTSDLLRGFPLKKVSFRLKK